MNKIVNIIDVTARDGLQNLGKIISTNNKIELINRLSNCGFKHIEVGSHVNPKLIQMADSLQVYDKIEKRNNVKYTMLIPNYKKFKEIEHGKISSISTITATSESFVRKNMNSDIKTSLIDIEQINNNRLINPFLLRVYISCCFGCPFEGEINLDKLKYILQNLPNNIDELVLSDTIGSITITKLEIILDMINNLNLANEKITLHIHCSDDKIESVIDTSLKYDIMNFDVSLSKLGGCPSAGKIINYNMSAIKVVEYLEYLGYTTGIDRDKLINTEDWLNRIIKE